MVDYSKGIDHGHLVRGVHVYTVRTPHRHSSRAALSGKVVLSAFPCFSMAVVGLSCVAVLLWLHC